jgi:hypothetical protein
MSTGVPVDISIPLYGTLKVKRSRKFVWRQPDRIHSRVLKNNKTQVKFKKINHKRKSLKVGWKKNYANYNNGNFYFRQKSLFYR